mgnify:CR=1 FL=1
MDGFLVNSDKRILRFRYSRDKLIVGTVGFLEGKVKLDERSVSIRRVDANANGRFSDPEDELWVDHDCDGRWNAFSERFPFAPMLRVADKRYSTFTDVRSQVFSMEANTQTGILSLDIPDALRKQGLEKLTVVMAGRTGSLVNLNLTSGSAQVPVDDYRPVSLVTTFVQDKAPEAWTYTFVSRGKENIEWIAVTSDSEQKINPLRELNLTAQFDRADGAYAKGRQVRITPVLSTADGLQLQGAFYGHTANISASGPMARVSLMADNSDDEMQIRTSGFN